MNIRAPIEPGLRFVAPSPRPALAKAPAAFGEALEGALNTLEAGQRGADEKASQLARGDGSLHETALALEKADIGMRVAVKVRNKAVEAYQEIMRMNV